MNGQAESPNDSHDATTLRRIPSLIAGPRHRGHVAFLRFHRIRSAADSALHGDPRGPPYETQPVGTADPVTGWALGSRSLRCPPHITQPEPETGARWGRRERPASRKSPSLGDSGASELDGPLQGFARSASRRRLEVLAHRARRHPSMGYVPLRGSPGPARHLVRSRPRRSEERPDRAPRGTGRETGAPFREPVDDACAPRCGTANPGRASAEAGP